MVNESFFLDGVTPLLANKNRIDKQIKNEKKTKKQKVKRQKVENSKKTEILGTAIALATGTRVGIVYGLLEVSP